jgi:hypothetical protein
LDERPLPNNSGQPHSPHHCSILWIYWNRKIKINKFD